MRGFEECPDLGEDAVAMGVPFFPAAEDEGAFSQAGEADVFYSGFAEGVEFCAQCFKEGELEAVACGAGGGDEGDGEGGGEGLEFFGDGFAADFDEHFADALEEVF